jgi:hypothetical protein
MIKKEVKEISKGVYYIKQYISKETAETLSKYLSSDPINTLNKTNAFEVYGGLSGSKLSNPGIVFGYGQSGNYNIAIDISTFILFSINELVSDYFKGKHQVKNWFFSCMKTGSSNPTHTDNYMINDNNEPVINPEFAFDKSAILYLNDNYVGGELFFPNQNLLVKPEIGDLIFFEGDLNKPHEVKKVTDGERHAFITFYEPEGYLADNANISK